MADYSSMKVPELKKLLGERGLPHTGNKADLIARLQENDKQQAASTAEPQADPKKPAAEDEIDYDDDDFPALNKDKKDAAAEKPAEATAGQTAPATTETKADGAVAATAAAAPPAEPKPDTTASATTATTTTAAEGADKTASAAAEPAAAGPLFTQNLPPTDAKTEAEKRAARAARFGLAADAESEEAKKAARAARFGLASDSVSALDRALPDRAAAAAGRKRGREEGGAAAGENARASKRSSSARNQSGGGGGGGGGRNQQQQQQQQQRGRRRGGGRGQNRDGASQSAGKRSAPVSVDPVEKAKMEARAKRFAS